MSEVKGYKLVPVEPTENMRLAFADQIRTGDYNPGTLVGDLCAGIYTAMLAVAPTPPQPIYDEAKERELFEAWANGVEGYSKEGTHFNWERFNIPYETLEELWQEFAQCRVKAGEVGHE